MLTEPLTPSALLFAAVTFALDRLVVTLRRRKRSKWRRLEKAIAIGVNAAWLSYTRPLKIARNNPDHHLSDQEVKQAHDLALSVAQAHANQTCPKLWRNLTDAEKCYLIDEALRQRRNKNQDSPKGKTQDAP